MNKTIYLDNAATTRMLPEAAEAMEPFLHEYYGNPSTLYELGEKSKEAMEGARAVIAETLHAKPEEIFFTSGGTESDNWAIKEAVSLYERTYGEKYARILTTPVEHHAILNTCKEMEQLHCGTDFLEVDETGRVILDKVEEKISDQTCLLSVMYANNEIGTMQPITELGKIAGKKDILFHTDAVQAYGHVPIHVQRDSIDMLSASAHKFGGPKGVGFLYIRKEIKLPAFIQGGGQENNRRSGTENVPGIVGMGKAAELANKRMLAENRRIYQLRNYLVKRILREIPQAMLTGSPNWRLANNASFCFKGVTGEAVVILLDTQGICASSGSACSMGNTETSHVLGAIGVDADWIHGALRFTLGADITKADIDFVVERLKMILADIRVA